jgi:hypothetical protein
VQDIDRALQDIGHALQDMEQGRRQPKNMKVRGAAAFPDVKEADIEHFGH